MEWRRKRLSEKEPHRLLTHFLKATAHWIKMDGGINMTTHWRAFQVALAAPEDALGNESTGGRACTLNCECATQARKMNDSGGSTAPDARFSSFFMKKPWHAIKHDSAGWCSDPSSALVFQDWSKSFTNHLNSNLTPSHLWRSEPSYWDLYFMMVLNPVEVWLQTVSQCWIGPASKFLNSLISPKMPTRT